AIDDGLIFDREAEIEADLLGQEPVVIPAALVLIILDGFMREGPPGEEFHSADDGFAIGFGDIDQNAVHVDDQDLGGWGHYQIGSRSERNLRICSRVPTVTRTQPSIS